MIAPLPQKHSNFAISDKQPLMFSLDCKFCCRYKNLTYHSTFGEKCQCCLGRLKSIFPRYSYCALTYCTLACSKIDAQAYIQYPESFYSDDRQKLKSKLILERYGILSDKIIKDRKLRAIKKYQKYGPYPKKYPSFWEVTKILKILKQIINQPITLNHEEV